MYFTLNECDDGSVDPIKLREFIYDIVQVFCRKGWGRVGGVQNILCDEGKGRIRTVSIDFTKRRILFVKNDT